MIKPAAFQLLSDPQDLGDYGFTPQSVNRHLFCKHCGVRVYTQGHVAEIGGDFVSVMLSTLDGLSDEFLASLPVQCADGRGNNWFHTPAVSSHL